MSSFTLPLAFLIICSAIASAADSSSLLPDGREFPTWERPLKFSRTYYVDNRHPRASDSNPGTRDNPFLTINHAALVLQPGERVVIAEGVYRERVNPARGGTSAEKMISYESAPGARVVIKGSRLIKAGWKTSTGFSRGWGRLAEESKARIYQAELDDLDFKGYNPFGMVNLPDDRSATGHLGDPPQGWRPYLQRRGLVYVDGRRLEQVDNYRDIPRKAGVYWAEHHGLTLHLRLPEDADPASHEVEIAIQEQVFAPRERHLGYIRVKGLTLEHASNGFPVLQRGLLSTNRGHHWIIEDCVLREANSVVLDIGNESWNADRFENAGYAIVRRNHVYEAGLCGIAGYGVSATLIEDNLIERVGWQNVEPMWESGGIKLHVTKDCLLRRNVIRHLRYAPGIWLDYGNRNTRATANVIGDIQETLRGGIYLEASHERNMLDHNIFWKITMGELGAARQPTHREGGTGIMVDGSDHSVIAHNLFGRCQYAGVWTRTVEDRIVEGRGGTTRDNRIFANVFYRCGKSIEFSHRDNLAEANIYGRDRSEGAGLNWVTTPEPLRLDLETWRDYLGFDKRGAMADLNVSVDLDALTLSATAAESLPQFPAEPSFANDLNGRNAAGGHQPGPLVSLVPGGSIDPRNPPQESGASLIGCETYSFRAMLQAKQLELAGLPELYQRIGLNGISYNDRFFSRFDDAYLDELKAVTYRNHLTITSYVVDGDLATQDEKARRKQIEIDKARLRVARRLGAPVVRINTGNTGDGEDPDTVGVERVIAAIRELLPIARDLGLRIGIENHGGPSSKSANIIRIIEATDPKLVGAIIDFGSFAPENRYQEIAALAPYAIGTHVKVTRFSTSGEIAAYDLGRVLHLLQQAHYRGPLSIEYEGAEPAEAGVAQAAKLIRAACP